MANEIARISIASPCMICHVSQCRHTIVGDEGKLAAWISLEFFLGILKNTIFLEFSNAPLAIIAVLNFALMVDLQSISVGGDAFDTFTLKSQGFPFDGAQAAFNDRQSLRYNPKALEAVAKFIRSSARD